MATYTTINKPSAQFHGKTYTGNGSTNNITGFDFQPDFVWGKDLGSAYSTYLYDSTRGVTKRLLTDTNAAESTLAQGLTAFNSDGFTLGSDAGMNDNTATVSAYAWKANGGTTSANGTGSICSTVQANTTAGFSIVKYTGTGSAGTVGHGLGVAPDAYWIKKYSDTATWANFFNYWYSGVNPSNYVTCFNTADGKINDASMFNDTMPTSTVFSIGGSGNVTASGEDYIAYCFNRVPGFSMFGSYMGGGTNQTYVATGFRPAWLLVKNVDSGSMEWVLKSDVMNTNNTMSTSVYPSTSESKHTSNNTFEFLATGFTATQNGGYSNTSGNQFQFAAFAANPIVGTNNVVGTAF